MSRFLKGTLYEFPVKRLHGMNVVDVFYIDRHRNKTGDNPRDTHTEKQGLGHDKTQKQ